MLTPADITIREIKEDTLKGALTYALYKWNLSFVHNNHGHQGKEIRYRVARREARRLQKHAIFLGYRQEGLIERVGYYTELDEEDVPPEAPENTRFEYFSGLVNREDNSIVFYAYYWLQEYSQLQEIANRYFD